MKKIKLLLLLMIVIPFITFSYAKNGHGSNQGYTLKIMVRANSLLENRFFD